MCTGEPAIPSTQMMPAIMKERAVSEIAARILTMVTKDISLSFGIKGKTMWKSNVRWVKPFNGYFS